VEEEELKREILNLLGENTELPDEVDEVLAEL
jgi:hypothetical protein